MPELTRADRGVVNGEWGWSPRLRDALTRGLEIGG